MNRIILPALHPAQKAIAIDTTRFKVLSCGRRWGKTRLAAALAIKRVLEGGQVMWVGPSYQIAEVGWRSLEWLGKQVPGTRQADRRIAVNQGWVQVRSADSEGGLRGEGLDLLIVDECAHIRNFGNIWEQELRPALSDRKGGAMFISTPKGFNHFSDLFQIQDGDWRSWQLPTSSNPFIDKDEIEAARQQLPALVFRQEYEAEFVQLAGAMFRREYFQFADNAPQMSQIRHWDLAASTKTQADYSVGARGGLDDNGNVYITDLVRGRWEWPALIRVIRETALSDGPEVNQSIETAGTQKGMLDLLMAEPGLSSIAFRGVTPTQDKITRAQPLLARAEQSKLILLRAAWNATMIDEFCAFPETEHDDQVDAVSGMLTACANSVDIDMADFGKVKNYVNKWS
jgi:predicted phage terminase large subunit-like protein